MPPDQEFDVGAAVDSISSDLFAGESNDSDTRLAAEDPGRSDGDGDSTVADASGADGKDPAGDGDGRTEGAEGGEKPAATTPALEAPKTWRADEAAEWEGLSPKAKEAIHRREQDFFRGIEQYRHDAAWGQDFQKVMKPFMPILDHHGVHPAVQIQQLMGAHATLVFGKPEEKVAMFQRLANDYGIPIDQLQVEAPYVDPQVKALQQELQGLKSAQQQHERQQFQQAQSAAGSEIDRFFADPARAANFDVLGDDIAALIRANPGMKLEVAYEKALWANPTTRAAEQGRQAKEAEAKRVATEKERAAKARQSTAANVRPSAKSASGTAPLSNMNDTLEATMAAIRRR